MQNRLPALNGKIKRAPPTRKKPKKRREPDMTALRAACQQWHALLAGTIEEFFSSLDDIEDEMLKDENHPIRRVWPLWAVRDLANELANLKCSICNLAVVAPPDMKLPAPLDHCRC